MPLVGMDGMIMGFLDCNEEMKYFGERVLPLMKQGGTAARVKQAHNLKDRLSPQPRRRGRDPDAGRP